MNKKRWMGIILVNMLLVLFTVACGTTQTENIQINVNNEGTNNHGVEESKSDSITIESSNSNNGEIHEEVTTDEYIFVSDTPAEQWNVYGNDFANLSQFGTPFGRITAQGEWTYYYSKGSIYKKHENEPALFVTNANDAYSLNIVGDWIYYKEGELVYKVRTDGESKENVLNNVSSNIFIADNEICYISKENKSATTYNYYLNVDDLETFSSIVHITIGEKPLTLIGFRPDLGKVFGYYEWYVEKMTFSAFEIDYNGNVNDIMKSTF